MNPVFKNIDKSWNVFTQNKRYLHISLLVDFLFIFSLAQVHLTFFLPSADAAARTAEAMGGVIEHLPDAELVDLDSLLKEDPAFMMAYRELLLNIVFFFLSALGAWLAFKSFAWYVSHKSIYPKMPLGTHLLKFCLLSLFWFILLIGAIFINQSLTAGPVPIVGQTFSTITFFALFFVLFYFANISFALIPAQQTFKKTFLYGYTHAKRILPAYLINIVLIFLGVTLPVTFGAFHPLLALATVIIFTVPALAFARLHMIISAWPEHHSFSRHRNRT